MNIGQPKNLINKTDFAGKRIAIVAARFNENITQALLDAGISPNNIRAVMGANMLRFLSENLPA